MSSQDFQAHHISEIVPENGVCENHHLNHHRNVVLTRNAKPVKSDGIACNSFNQYCVRLRDISWSEGHSLADDVKKTQLLLRITLGLRHLHESSCYLGTLSPSNIFLSKDLQEVVVTDIDSTDGRTDQRKKDFEGLKSVYVFVLTNGRDSDSDLSYSEPALAKDLIDVVSRLIKSEKEFQKEGTTFILKHPIFWTPLQKINFIIAVYGHLRGKQMPENFDEKGKNVIDRDWITRLELSGREQDDIKAFAGGNVVEDRNLIKNSRIRKFFHVYTYDEDSKSFAPRYKDLREEKKNEYKTNWTPFKYEKREQRQSLNGRIKAVQLGEVNGYFKDEADGNILIVIAVKRDKYHKDSIVDLLRFIRNSACHLSERKVIHWFAFQGYPCGFWRFFSSRYPNLFQFVHDFARTEGLAELREAGNASLRSCSESISSVNLG